MRARARRRKSRRGVPKTSRGGAEGGLAWARVRMQSAQLGMAATSLSPWERSAEAEAERLEREAEDGWQRWRPPHLDVWLVDDFTEADVANLLM